MDATKLSEELIGRVRAMLDEVETKTTEFVRDAGDEANELTTSADEKANRLIASAEDKANGLVANAEKTAKVVMVRAERTARETVASAEETAQEKIANAEKLAKERTASAEELAKERIAMAEADAERIRSVAESESQARLARVREALSGLEGVVDDWNFAEDSASSSETDSDSDSAEVKQFAPARPNRDSTQGMRRFAGKRSHDSAAARVVAMKMAMEGTSRERISSHIDKSYEIESTDELLDDVMTRAPRAESG